jgi:enoyl-CoA hydratase/carnithine racemase
MSPDCRHSTIGDQRKGNLVDKNLLLTERNKNVCTLVLNRPEKKNSLSPELVQTLLDKLEQLAAEISANAPRAVKGTKRILNLLLNSSQPPEHCQKEAESITEAAFLSEDLKEGRLAFLEKRKPNFKGK